MDLFRDVECGNSCSNEFRFQIFKLRIDSKSQNRGKHTHTHIHTQKEQYPFTDRKTDRTKDRHVKTDRQ